MLIETRSLLARAATNRYLLLQLIEQVPGDRWASRASDDAWSAHGHLAHLASIDDVTAALLASRRDGAYRLDLGLQAVRIRAVEERIAESTEELRRLLDASRAGLLNVVAELDEGSLATPVLIDVPGSWPPVLQLSLRAYLAAWAEHDAEHTLAIRRAITIPPSASDLALVARFGQR